MAPALLTKNTIYIALATAGLLMIPLVVMQFSSEVNWTSSDFAIMGILVFGTGLVLDLVWRKAGTYRAIAAAAIVAVFLFIWAELAVGVFTNLGS